MPNKCTLCGKIHPDDADYLLSGCDECGCKFFFYFKEGSLERLESDIQNLTEGDMKEIEKDVRDILPETVEREDTVVLDLESIRIVAPGKYKIDVTNLFNQRPIVIRLGPGKYELDLSTLITKWKDKIIKDSST